MPIYQLDDKQPVLPEGDGFWCAPDAHVIGDVIIGSDVGVWFGAVLRGDNEPITIGRRTNIQEGVMIHSDPGFPVTIAEGCSIGHHAIVHGASIGANTLVGMGAIVLNGAVIGQNCLIGANALVTEGKVIPDGSLVVGAPAKVVRTLESAAIDGIRKNAMDYVEKMKGLKGRLNVISLPH